MSPCGPRPLIDADQRRRPEVPGRFLQRLAGAGGHQRFAFVEMPGRLVEADAVLGLLLDQQKAAVALDERGDGDVGFPDAIHGPAFYRPRDSPNPLRLRFNDTLENSTMSMADRDGFIWYDGKLVPWREATTHVLTHSLHYGLAVFEGVRAYKTVNGTAIFRLKEHTDRLFNSAHIYRMPMPWDKETLMEAQKEVVRANKLESCYLRPIAFYGSEKMGVSPARRQDARRHRRLALGRLPRRGRHGEGHPRQDFQLRPPPRQCLDVPRQVLRHLRQLDPRQHGSDRARLRRGAAARRRRLRRRRRGREPVRRQGRQDLRTGDRLGADRHHPRLGACAGARNSATRSSPSA